MKPFKHLLALVSTAALTAAPSLARVDSGTPALLRSVEAHGVAVALNPPRCTGASYMGSYHPSPKVLTVCYDGRPDAADHDTVRHEVFHAAQHCAAEKRGRRHTLVPILNGKQLSNFITDSLTQREIDGIRKTYPASKHPTELEAFAAAKVYTAAEINRIFVTWCRG